MILDFRPLSMGENMVRRIWWLWFAISCYCKLKIVDIKKLITGNMWWWYIADTMLQTVNTITIPIITIIIITITITMGKHGDDGLLTCCCMLTSQATQHCSLGQHTQRDFGDNKYNTKTQQIQWQKHNKYTNTNLTKLSQATHHCSLGQHTQRDKHRWLLWQLFKNIWNILA